MAKNISISDEVHDALSKLRGKIKGKYTKEKTESFDDVIRKLLKE